MLERCQLVVLVHTDSLCFALIYFWKKWFLFTWFTNNHVRLEWQRNNPIYLWLCIVSHKWSMSNTSSTLQNNTIFIVCKGMQITNIHRPIWPRAFEKSAKESVHSSARVSLSFRWMGYCWSVKISHAWMAEAKYSSIHSDTCLLPIYFFLLFCTNTMNRILIERVKVVVKSFCVQFSCVHSLSRSSLLFYF